MSILSELFNEDFSKELHEQQLNELTQPYGRTTGAINRAKSAVKGLVGGGQYEQGAEQAGQLANRYFMNFKRYIGSKYGRKPQYVTYDDVKGFMDSNKLDSSDLGTNQNMTFTPKDVASLFLKAAQEQVSSGMVPPAQAAGSNPPAAQGNSGTSGQPQGQGNSGQPQGQGNNNQPQGSGTPPASGGSNSTIPSTLAQLSQAQRTQLLSILSRI